MLLSARSGFGGAAADSYFFPTILSK